MDSSLFRLRSRELARASQRPRPANQIHVDVEAVVDGIVVDARAVTDRTVRTVPTTEFAPALEHVDDAIDE